jgi:hypothetical protein
MKNYLFSLIVSLLCFITGIKTIWLLLFIPNVLQSYTDFTDNIFFILFYFTYQSHLYSTSISSVVVPFLSFTQPTKLSQWTQLDGRALSNGTGKVLSVGSGIQQRRMPL